MSDDRTAALLARLESQPALEDAARFVHDVLLKTHSRDGRFVVAALVPVVGLARSGRTSLLAALGRVLAGPRERFPLEHEGRVALEPFSLLAALEPAGGHVAHAAALAPWVADLGRESQRLVETAFARGQFPPPTALPAGVRFLVAALERDDAPFARLVTLEVESNATTAVFLAGGEPDPIAALRALGDDTPAGVLAGSLERATGVVLAVDATRDLEASDRDHEPFARLLALGLRARAGDAHRALAKQLEREETSGERATLAAVVFRLRKSLERLGEELCLELERPLLETMATALGPEGEDGATLEPATRGDRRRLLRDLGAVADERALIRELGPRLMAGLGRAPSRRRAAFGLELDRWTRAAARLRGVSLETAARWLEAGASDGAFPRLRGLSLVYTKGDTARGCSGRARESRVATPPRRRSLLDGHASGPWLEEVQGALRFLGGDLREYESSATGSTGLVGAASQPGPVETQTPIAVVEPFFDILGIPRRGIG